MRRWSIYIHMVYIYVSSFWCFAVCLQSVTCVLKEVHDPDDVVDSEMNDPCRLRLLSLKPFVEGHVVSKISPRGAWAGL